MLAGPTCDWFLQVECCHAININVIQTLLPISNLTQLLARGFSSDFLQYVSTIFFQINQHLPSFDVFLGVFEITLLVVLCLLLTVFSGLALSMTTSSKIEQSEFPWENIFLRIDLFPGLLSGAEKICYYYAVYQDNTDNTNHQECCPWSRQIHLVVLSLFCLRKEFKRAN